ncbi:MAG: NAD-binding protein [Planctomycetota bacterium]
MARPLHHQGTAGSIFRLRLSVAGLAILHLSGTIALKLVADDYTWFDAFYMCLITISTVGFHEIGELSVAGRLVTSFLIMGGLFLVAAATGSFIESIVEGNLAQHFGRRRLDRQIAQLKDHWIICGYGRLGQFVVRELLLGSKAPSFVVIDNSEDRVRLLEDEGLLYILGDATQDEVLAAAGIDRARGILVLVDTDAENVFICLSARSTNPSLRIVAGAHDEHSEAKLKRAGANKVISPYKLGGSRLSLAITRPSVQDFLDFAQGQELEVMLEELQLEETSSLAGVKLRDSPLRTNLNLIVLAVKRRDGPMLFNPGGDTTLEGGDTLVVLGSQPNLQTLAKSC